MWASAASAADAWPQPRAECSRAARGVSAVKILRVLVEITDASECHRYILRSRLPLMPSRSLPSIVTVEGIYYTRNTLFSFGGFRGRDKPAQLRHQA